MTALSANEFVDWEVCTGLTAFQTVLGSPRRAKKRAESRSERFDCRDRNPTLHRKTVRIGCFHGDRREKWEKKSNFVPLRAVLSISRYYIGPIFDVLFRTITNCTE